VLEALLNRPGAVLSKAQLEERIYGWGEEIASNTVEVHIHGLRKKLGADAIRTVRGVGYMMPVQGAQNTPNTPNTPNSPNSPNASDHATSPEGK
jgi:two-component system response regulator QseB